jgi:hypothetical protein
MQCRIIDLSKIAHVTNENLISKINLRIIRIQESKDTETNKIIIKHRLKKTF